MSRFGSAAPILALLLILTACATPAQAPAANPQSTGSGGAPEARTQAPRTLAMSIRTEPTTMGRKSLVQGGTTFTTTLRAFNATLGQFDGTGNPRPYLAAALPQLNTDTWQVLPDGRMETTYRLKPGITWHDGTPLTADDYVFAWRVYTSPQVGIASIAPQNLMSEVRAVDTTTFTVSWTRPFPNAGVLGDDEFPALPRHLIEAAFEREPELMPTLQYWTRDYIGLGPYKLSRWEPGAFLEGVAFDGHVLGRPKIERVKLDFIGDPNVALTRLLSGDTQLAADTSVRFQQGLTLQRDRASEGWGVLIKPDLWRGSYSQLRPHLVGQPAILDVRVRRALAHSTDRQSLNDGMYEGQGIMSEAPYIPPTVSYYREVDQAIVKYAFDPRSTDRLMAEAGYSKGADGGFTGPNGRVDFDLRTLGAGEREQEMAILANGWRNAGFEVRESVMPATMSTDTEARATFSGIFTYSSGWGEYALAGMVTSSIPAPENRWQGPNRGAWSNPEFDRVAVAFTNAIAQAERVRHIAQMARVFTEDLPSIPIQFDLITMAHAPSLTGLRNVAQEAAVAWNIEEWDLR